MGSGKEDRNYGVPFILYPKYHSLCKEVKQANERTLGKSIKLQYTSISIIQIYAPQFGMLVGAKKQFYQTLQDAVDVIKYKEHPTILGYFNGHIGTKRRNLEIVVGEHSIGERNEDGKRTVDIAVVNNIAIMNNFYEHMESQKWTWYR